MTIGGASLRLADRHAERLADLEARAEVLLAEFGLAADSAQHIAHALADHLAAHWGGQTLSFPKDVAYALSKRERAILARHRLGATVAELAREFGLGERGMRKLLARARLRDVHLDQTSFDGPGFEKRT